MSFHDDLIRTRQDDLLREAARIRLAAQARRAWRIAAALILVGPRASRPEGRAL
jgi:hypothetical protein